MRFRAALLVALGFAGLVACEPSPPAWPDDSLGSSPASTAAPPPIPKSPPGRFFRAELDDYLLAGPSASVLSHIDVEEVIREGSFYGWRITAMPEAWAALALRPGDVVTRVNGAVIEHPDDIWAVWLELSKAKDVRIAYEHEGIGRELLMPIDGNPNPKTFERLQVISAPSGPAKQPKGTIVIEEGISNPADQDADAAAPGSRESVTVGGGAAAKDKEGSGKKDGSRPKK